MAMKTSKLIAKRIKMLLLEKNITQYKLCKNMAIPKTTLTNIMAAKNKSVNLKTIMIICRGIDITAGEFFKDPLFDNPELDID
jgi:transcriptional regulator with XRE-family HTH domain